VNKAVLNSLTEAEGLLVRETEPEALAGLDEDELLELHVRVRRARTKYAKLYRRAAAAAVDDRGGRGASYARNQRNRDKAEVFELALARVSKEVSVVARKAAADLRAERIAAARADRGSGPTADAAGGAGATAKESARRRTTKTTGGVKKDASSQAKGARRQAARDAR
jgi:hypothetical protein